MKKELFYIALLAKSFFKKKTYIALILMIPILGVALRMVDDSKQGLIAVAVVDETCDSKLVQQVIDGLLTDSDVMKVMEYENMQSAMDDLSMHQVSAVWVFLPDYDQLIEEYYRDGSVWEAPIQIYEREDTVTLQLVRMKLFDEVYKSIAYGAYTSEVVGTLKENGMEEVDKTLLEDIFQLNLSDEAMFEGVYQNGLREEASYITGPFRGLLSTLILAGGMSAVLYYYQDEKRGQFDGITAKKRKLRMYEYLLVAITPIAFCCYWAMKLANVTVSVSVELVAMLLFIIDTVFFVAVIKRILISEKLFGSSIPWVLIMSIMLGPTFINVRQMRFLQLLIPQYYYLNAVNGSQCYIQMLIYAAIVGLLSYPVLSS